MKKLQFLGIILILVSASYTAHAQIQSVSEVSITPPTFIHDDYTSLNAFLSSSIDYPPQSLHSGYQGAEIIRFTVTSMGNIDNITVVNSVSREIDKMVINQLKETRGYWKPGIINGEQTAMERELVLQFVLYSLDEYLQTARNYMAKGNKLLFEKDKTARALEYYEKAYALVPTEVSTLTMKGYCLQRLGRNEEAAEINLRLGHLSGLKTETNVKGEEQLVFVREPIEVMIASTQ